MIVAPLWSDKHVNIGSLARTCEAIGADLVVASSFKREIRNGNTCKYPPLFLERDDIPRWVKYQSQSSRLLLGLETGGQPISGYQPIDDMVLLIGAEGSGIPDWAIQLCDDIITLPQLGQAPCINMAVAGSIAAYYLSGLLD